MGRLFGTDGVRGVGNVDLTPELALDLGRALVGVLREEGEKRPSILIGRDPRWSGEMLEAALVAGITSAGGDAVTIGVLPTPAVAYLTARGGARAGPLERRERWEDRGGSLRDEFLPRGGRLGVPGALGADGADRLQRVGGGDRDAQQKVYGHRRTSYTTFPPGPRFREVAEFFRR